VSRRTLAIAAAVVMLVLAAPVFAQIATTSLRGVVTDPSGAIIPGATVTVTNGATGQSFSANANSAGVYIFAAIPPANYAIKAVAKGFADQTKVAELLVNQPATVNFTMTLQAVSQEVNVSAEAETLNTTDASLGNSMGNGQLDSAFLAGTVLLALRSVHDWYELLQRRPDCAASSHQSRHGG